MSIRNYTVLLRDMGKSEPEIEQEIEKLRRGEP
jgi:hypothetical protein